jgi:tetratricopeptide (TPR) repeat protein
MNIPSDHDSFSPIILHTHQISDNQRLNLNISSTEVIKQQGEEGLYTAKMTIKIVDPNTGEIKKYLLTRGDIEIDDQTPNSQINDQVTRIATEAIVNDDNATLSIIKLGLTHFTPHSTTARVNFDNTSNEFSIIKGNSPKRAYQGQHTPIMDERTGEILAKCQLWNTLNYINTQNRENLPPALQEIKGKIPNGPITAADQSTINTFILQNDRWYQRESDKWIDVKTNKLATGGVNLPDPFDVKSNAKDIGPQELNNIPAKANKWNQKYNVLQKVHDTGNIWKQHFHEESEVQYIEQPHQLSFTPALPQQSHQVILDEANEFPTNTLEGLEQGIAKLEEIPQALRPDDVRQALADRYNRRGVKLSYAGKQEEASKSYQKAAELGDNSGALNLALAYKEGKGVAKNLHQALKYYQLALHNDEKITQSSPFGRNRELYTSQMNELESQLAPEPIILSDQQQQDSELAENIELKIKQTETTITQRIQVLQAPFTIDEQDYTIEQLNTNLQVINGLQDSPFDDLSKKQILNITEGNIQKRKDALTKLHQLKGALKNSGEENPEVTALFNAAQKSTPLLGSKIDAINRLHKQHHIRENASSLLVILKQKFPKDQEIQKLANKETKKLSEKECEFIDNRMGQLVVDFFKEQCEVDETLEPITKEFENPSFYGLYQEATAGSGMDEMEVMTEFYRLQENTDWLIDRADKGDPIACYALGYNYYGNEDGDPIDVTAENVDLAVKYLEMGKDHFKPAAVLFKTITRKEGLDPLFPANKLNDI